MAFNGKWHLVSCENIDPFIDACGADRGKLGPLIGGMQQTGPNGYVEELHQVGNELNRKVFIGGQLKRDKTTPLDKECEGERWDGLPVRYTVSIAGHKLTRIEKGGNQEIRIEAEVSGDAIVMTMHCGAVACVRKYKKC